MPDFNFFIDILNVHNSRLNNIFLGKLAEHIIDKDSKKYFLEPAGKEHYRLLSYMSLICKDAVILDIGTNKGASALALSINKSNHIISADVGNYIRLTGMEELQNISFIINPDITKDKSFLNSCFIVLDTLHLGDYEELVYRFLFNNGYKGCLFCDDIHLNAEMEYFWKSVKNTKADLTYKGHITGSGLINFNKG